MDLIASFQSEGASSKILLWINVSLSHNVYPPFFTMLFVNYDGSMVN